MKIIFLIVSIVIIASCVKLYLFNDSEKIEDCFKANSTQYVLGRVKDELAGEWSINSSKSFILNKNGKFFLLKDRKFIEFVGSYKITQNQNEEYIIQSDYNELNGIIYICSQELTVNSIIYIKLCDCQIR